MRYVSLILAIWFAVQTVFLTNAAFATAIQMGVSVDKVPVGSDFDGEDIVVFGSIEGVAIDALNRGEYHVVVNVQGGKHDVVIREKERTFGIWINNESETFESIPSFYAVVSASPLRDIANPDVLNRIGLGIDNLGSAEAAAAGEKFVIEDGKFADALRRIKKDKGLYFENDEGLTQLSPSLFRARVALPPNVPIGEHMVTAHLFRNGLHLYSKSATFEIGKVGFERWIYNLAHEQGLLYGFMAVFVAIFTGWAANAIFRKN